jgi:putative transposase
VQAAFVCVVDLLLCRLIDEEYTRRPFYGKRFTAHL